MAIMAALGHQLSHEPAEMDWNLKHLRLMKQVAEQSHFHNVEHHPDAVGTLEDIRANKKARQLAGWGFIAHLGCMYRMRLGKRKMTLLLDPRDLKYFEK